MADDPKVLRGAEAVAEVQRQLGLLRVREGGGESPPLLCDRPECKRTVDEESAHMVCVELRSYRVNTQRWWRFCAAKCRDKWYDAGDESDLLAHTPHEKHVELQAERARAHESVSLDEEDARTVRDVAFEAEGQAHDHPALARVRGAERALERVVAGFVDSDRDIEYRVHHVTKQGKAAPLIEGREALRHEDAASVNAYWRTPAGE